MIDRWLQAVKVQRSNRIITVDFRRARPAVVPQGSLFSADVPGDELTENFLRLLSRSSDMRCVVFDGGGGLMPALFARQGHAHFFAQVRLLSSVDCRAILPAYFFRGPDFQNLHYLDISSKSTRMDTFSGIFTRHKMPRLRILKLRGWNMESAVAERFLEAFAYQLSSLDVSRSSLGTAFLSDLLRWGFNPRRAPFRTTYQHIAVEGMLCGIVSVVDPTRLCYFIRESPWSATFCHPARYLADPPRYQPRAEDAGPRHFTRLAGTEAIRGDSLDDTIRALEGGPLDPVPHQDDLAHDAPTGLTHLHLNDLSINMVDVVAVLLHYGRSLEHFECNKALLAYTKDTEWLSKTVYPLVRYAVYGLPGLSYLFRPVFQSNLCVLKIHHSLVTNIPSLGFAPHRSGGGDAPTSTLQGLWIAETHLRARLDTVFPQTYVPDMNPRLQSLTLSGIPRRSAGVVTDRLVRFLQLAAAQEQGIERTRPANSHYRSPPVVRGLRHIRFEFASDPGLRAGGESGYSRALETDEDVIGAMEELGSVSANPWDSMGSASDEAGDAAAANDTATAASAAPAPGPTPPDHREAEHQQQQSPPPNPRLTAFPYNCTNTEYFEHPLPIAADGSRRTVLVWIGPGILGGTGTGAGEGAGERSSSRHTAAVDEYMLTLAAGGYAVQTEPTLATPAHAAAGVPEGALIYGRAWGRMLFDPPPLPRPLAGTVAAPRGPGPAERDMMRRGDVLAGIKAFRAASKGRYAAAEDAKRRLREGEDVVVPEHDFWKGKLDVEFDGATA